MPTPESTVTLSLSVSPRTPSTGATLVGARDRFIKTFRLRKTFSLRGGGGGGGGGDDDAELCDAPATGSWVAEKFYRKRTATVGAEKKTSETRLLDENGWRRRHRGDQGANRAPAGGLERRQPGQ